MSGIVQSLLASFAGTPQGFSLFGWGANGRGSVGDNTTVYKSSPVQVGLLTTWTNVSTGGRSSGAINNLGELYSWGNNGDGQLGLNDRSFRSSPVQVGALTNWLSVSVGVGDNYAAFTLALKSDAAMWGWGNNNNRTIDFPTSNSRSSPIQINSGIDWAFVVAGGGSAMAISTGGDLYTWGNQGSGRLGDNKSSGTASSLQLISSVTSWASATIHDATARAIKTDGTLWTWGSNSFGMLGTNESIQPGRSSPVQIGALTDWSIASSGDSMAAALRVGGALYMWGRNHSGQLGLNDTNNRSSPVQLGGSWKFVSCGQTQVHAISSVDNLWSWGGRSDGAQGHNDYIFRSSPVQVGSDTSWVTVDSNNNVLALKK